MFSPFSREATWTFRKCVKKILLHNRDANKSTNGYKIEILPSKTKNHTVSYQFDIGIGNSSQHFLPPFCYKVSSNLHNCSFYVLLKYLLLTNLLSFVYIGYIYLYTVVPFFFYFYNHASQTW